MRTAEPFETRRMHLRALAPEDERGYCALYTSPVVMARIADPLAPAAARAGFLAAVRHNAAPEGTRRHWTIVDRATQASVGLMAVFLDPNDRSDAEFGVMLVPEAHGNGLAQELCEAVFARAFAPGGWGLRRLWVRHVPGHAAVAAVMAAVGFVPAAASGAYGTGEMTREHWAGRHA